MSVLSTFSAPAHGPVVAGAVALVVTLIKTAAPLLLPILLAIFIALLFWGWLFGTVGMFLAVPLATSSIIALDASPHTRPLAI
jgi:predicted PurR-regulated permease PerM